jgi:hypothetical protein
MGSTHAKFTVSLLLRASSACWGLACCWAGVKTAHGEDYCSSRMIVCGRADAALLDLRAVRVLREDWRLFVT